MDASSFNKNYGTHLFCHGDISTLDGLDYIAGLILGSSYLGPLFQPRLLGAGDGWISAGPPAIPEYGPQKIWLKCQRPLLAKPCEHHDLGIEPRVLSRVQDPVLFV